MLIIHIYWFIEYNSELNKFKKMQSSKFIGDIVRYLVEKYVPRIQQSRFTGHLVQEQ